MCKVVVAGVEISNASLSAGLMEDFPLLEDMVADIFCCAEVVGCFLVLTLGLGPGLALVGIAAQELG